MYILNFIDNNSFDTAQSENKQFNIKVIKRKIRGKIYINCRKIVKSSYKSCGFDNLEMCKIWGNED